MNKIQVGISTASLFKRMYNEEAVRLLFEKGVATCEIFLGTFREYEPKFAALLKERKGNLPVHSLHTLNTHFEPQLFSVNPRAMEDAYAICEKVLDSARLLGAGYYTFHGVERVKKTVTYTDYDDLARKFSLLCDKCCEYGVTLALENVEWAFYNHPGFFKQIRMRCPALRGTLDIKQARDAGEGYEAYLNEMGEDIVTVHLSDIGEDGKLCLPGRGITDFGLLFKRLADAGFCGAALIEVYNENYRTTDELFASYAYLSELKYKLGI